MGKGFKHGAGGGNPLNFKVVGGTSAPASPKENMIWVNTDQEITSWVISPRTPSAAYKGVVWIHNSTTSEATFDALKENGIYLYPAGARQYVGGTWVDKQAQIYKGNRWVSFYKYLYNKGDLCTSITGGYTAKALSLENYIAKAPSIGYNSSTMTIDLVKDLATASGIVYASTMIDLTNFTSLVFNGSATAKYDSNLKMCVWSDLSGTEVASVTVRAKTTQSLNVSAISGNMYVGFAVLTSANTNETQSHIEVSELYLK